LEIFDFLLKIILKKNSFVSYRSVASADENDDEYNNHNDHNDNNDHNDDDNNNDEERFNPHLREDTIHVFVKDLEGKYCDFHMGKNDNVCEVKGRVEYIWSIGYEKQRLLFRGKPMSDEVVLKDISDANTIKFHMVLETVGFVLNYSKFVVYFYKK